MSCGILLIRICQVISSWSHERWNQTCFYIVVPLWVNESIIGDNKTELTQHNIFANVTFLVDNSFLSHSSNTFNVKANITLSKADKKILLIRFLIFSWWTFSWGWQYGTFQYIMFLGCVLNLADLVIRYLHAIWRTSF